MCAPSVAPDGESAPKGRQFSGQQSRVLVLRCMITPNRSKVLKSLVSARRLQDRLVRMRCTHANCSSSGT